MIKFALEYAARGWAVFPLTPGDKTPITKNGFYDASKDPAVITKWWTKTPNANIGIATGIVSGICVLDVDEKPLKNVSGSATLSGHPEWLVPETFTVQTGGGGKHYYFLCDRPMASKNGFAPGLDFKADGGYVVAPGSTHESGRRYELIPNCCGPDPLPEWLPPVRTAPIERSLAPRAEFPPASPKILEQALQHLLLNHGPSIQGQNGDGHAYEMAAILCNDFALQPKEAWAVASEWNKICKPPFSNAELVTKLNNAMSYARGAYGDLRTNPLITEVDTLDTVPAPSSGPDNDYSDYATDLGNAHLLAETARDSLRYVTEWARWLVWDGKCWAPEKKAEAMNAAQSVVFDVLGKAHTDAASKVSDLEKQLQAITVGNEPGQVMTIEQGKRITALEGDLDNATKLCKSAYGRFIRAQSLPALNSMLTLAGTLPGIAVSATSLDLDPWLLNVSNGTINLRTGILLPHKREDLQTRFAPVDYDPNARSLLWERFVSETMKGDNELISYLQRAAGYTLTGQNSSECFFFLQGEGQNGKSTFVNTIASMLGPYAKPIKSLMLKNQNVHENFWAFLQGARMLIHPEPTKGATFDDGAAKMLTGGDFIEARRSYSKTNVSFICTGKVWMFSNPRPNIDAGDDGMWRRVKLVLFNNSIPMEKRDNSIKERLLAGPEWPGVLAWAVKGCMAWQRGGLQEPGVMLAAIAEYRSQSSMTQIMFDEVFERSPGCKVSTIEAVEAATGWFKRANMKLPEIRTFNNDFGQVLGSKPFKSHSKQWWKGIFVRGGAKDAHTEDELEEAQNG